MKTGTVLGRIAAFEMGLAPTEIWRTFREFEDDVETLVGLLELLEAEAKPILEEKARKTKG